MHQKDLALLEQIKSFFGVGSIHKQGLLSIQYHVTSVKDLSIIIMHFDKYTLITQKQTDYLLFKQVLNLINRKEHLTIEGLQKIKAIKASMNLGLSKELKVAFPDTIPVQRPLVDNKEIMDPNWVSGLTLGEGCLWLT